MNFLAKLWRSTGQGLRLRPGPPADSGGRFPATKYHPSCTQSATMPVTTDDRRFQLPADPRTPDPALEAQRNDLREMLLRGFDPTERLLVILYYFEEMTMGEVGATLGISESRVSQLHTLVVARIKADLMRKKVEWQ